MRAFGFLALLFGLIGGAQAAVPAKPVAVAPSGVIEGSSVSFTWGAVSGASWYQLWIADAAASPRLAQWYTAANLGCAGGGACTASLTVGLAAGPGQWWVRGWNAEGNGPWSDAKAFHIRYVPGAWAERIPAAARFQLVLDGSAALDRETGFVWQRNLNQNPASWQDAWRYCQNLRLGAPDRWGWRLPSVDELQTLLQSGPTLPYLPPGHPFVTNGWSYTWTATPWWSTPTTHHVYVIMSNGFVGSAGPNDTAYMLCVRGQSGSSRN